MSLQITIEEGRSKIRELALTRSRSYLEGSCHIQGNDPAPVVDEAGGSAASLEGARELFYSFVELLGIYQWMCGGQSGEIARSGRFCHQHFSDSHRQKRYYIVASRSGVSRSSV